jgi:hypothetical protein
VDAPRVFLIGIQFYSNVFHFGTANERFSKIFRLAENEM